MSVSGICEVCQEPASERCERCGSIVCTEHYDAEVGYCVACARTLERGEGSEDPEAGDTFTF